MVSSEFAPDGYLSEAAIDSVLKDAVFAVQVTLECLNCFADVIPYNHARLQVSQGQVESGTSLRLTLADNAK